jgi:hypothetical protein
VVGSPGWDPGTRCPAPTWWRLLSVAQACPGSPPSDVTNYLGGIADVLEDKPHRRNVQHLGDLAGVALYDNDRQFVEVTFRREMSETASYAVRLSGMR